MATAVPAAADDFSGSRTLPVVLEPGPPNYPEYDPKYEVSQVGAPDTTAIADQDTGLDASSAALGALAGIALAGAGLGAAFAVARHRDHPAAPQSA